MQQDSLQHQAAPLSEQAVQTLPGESEEGHAAAPLHHRAAPADTLPTPDSLVRPLPAGMPFTAKPEVLRSDRWADNLIRFEKSGILQSLESATGRRDTTYMAYRTTGMAGDPVPYRFQTDHFVNISLMVAFFLVVGVISRSRHYLHEQLKGFFYQRTRTNLFTERTDTELRGQIFLVFQTCFMLGVLFFDYVQERQTEVFNQVSPYKILSAGILGGVLYYLVKICIYSFVNRIFFSREKCKQWNEALMLTTLAFGLSLLPVGLLVVYFHLEYAHMTGLFLIILGVCKILLYYKCSRIFFSYRYGSVHLILYLCSLEIVPFLMLYKALTSYGNVLLTIQ